MIIRDWRGEEEEKIEVKKGWREGMLLKKRYEEKIK